MKAKPARHPGEVVLEIDRQDESMLEAGNRQAASPFRLKRILVPTDFSDCARKALQYAVPLAKEHQAAITLLFVVPTNYAVGEYGGIDFASIEAEARASAEKALSTLVVDEIRGELSANTLVRSGTPDVEILAMAKTLPADLIVISTHGRTGLKHVLLGSVAEHVVRRAPCPVLVVRPHEREFIVE